MTWALPLIAATGAVVGVINGMAGGASIISYPVLLWSGLNPISAVVSNAVGVTAANFAALRAHPHRLLDLLRDNAAVTAASVAGTIIGAAALLTLPVRVLEHAIPFLLAVATLTLLVRPHPTQHPSRRSEAAAMLGTGLYCGYFGPGQGVMVTAVLARDGRRTPALLNATKNAVVAATATVSNVIYIASGHVHWPSTIALALGATVGGLYGGRWATRLAPAFYRGLVFAVGALSSAWLFTRYF